MWKKSYSFPHQPSEDFWLNSLSLLHKSNFQHKLCALTRCSRSSSHGVNMKECKCFYFSSLSIHFFFSFFFYTFLTNKSLKASQNYKSSVHVLAPASLWWPNGRDSDSKWDFLFSFIFFIFFVRAVHLLPLQLLFDGVMEKANWTSGEETKSRFLWWKPEVSTGCRTSKLHFPATHFTTLFFMLVRVRARACMCTECIEEPFCAVEILQLAAKDGSRRELMCGCPGSDGSCGDVEQIWNWRRPLGPRFL